MEDANVACKMLGLGRAIGFVNEYSWPNFGPGDWSSQIWFDDLRCTGEESNFFDCIHRGVGNGDCHHNRDVGVVCERKSLQMKKNPLYYPSLLRIKPYQAETNGDFMMHFRTLLRS